MIHIFFSISQSFKNLILHIASILFFSKQRSACRNILVLRSSRFGDFINAMPALYLLRKEFPSAHIVLYLVPSADKISGQRTADFGYKDILKHGIVDESICYKISSLKSVFSHEVKKKISSFNPDMTLMLPFSGENLKSRLKKLIFLRLLGVKKNVYGWRMHWTLDIFKRYLFEHQLIEHQILGPLRALNEVGIQFVIPDDIRFPVRTDEIVVKYVNGLWKKLNLLGKKIIAFFPGGTFRHKRWSPEKFIQLGKQLSKDDNIVIIVLGGNNERRISDQICSALPCKIHNLAGELDYIQLAEVLRRSSVFIGNDSGPAHLASAVGCPSVTIFSSIVYPGIWEPWNFFEYAVRSEVDCKYCFSEHACANNSQKCIESISVEKVLGAVCKVLTPRNM